MADTIESMKTLKRISVAMSAGKIKFPEGDAQQHQFAMKLMGITRQLGAGNPSVRELADLERELTDLGYIH
jgi:hypothetical protein